MRFEPKLPQLPVKANLSGSEIDRAWNPRPITSNNIISVNGKRFEPASTADLQQLSFPFYTIRYIDSTPLPTVVLVYLDSRKGSHNFYSRCAI